MYHRNIFFCVLLLFFTQDTKSGINRDRTFVALIARCLVYSITCSMVFYYVVDYAIELVKDYILGPNQKNKCGWTPLYLAVLSNDLQKNKSTACRFKTRP